MAFQAVPDVCQFVLEWGNDALQWSNVFHFNKVDYTFGDMETGAQAMFEAASTSTWMLALCNDWGVRHCRAYDLREEGAPVFTYTTTPVLGTDTGQSLPIQNALVMTLRTNTRGRRGRGRLYLAGLGENSHADGVFNTTTRTRAEDLLSDIQTSMASYGWLWGVVSRWADKVKLTEGQLIPITSYECRSLIPGNQQRRSQRP